MPVFDPILVTGAAGFIGAAATHALSARGHTVHVLLRSPDPWRLSAMTPAPRVHLADLTDADRVDTIIREVRPRVILHLAAYGAYESQGDARTIFQTALLGSYNLLESAVRHGVERLINAGSSSEYGFKSEPMQEREVLEPNSFYAVAKAAQTHLTTLMARRSDLKTTTFRLFSVYGPWEEPTRLIPTILQRARAGLPLQMVAPTVARDFIAVDDVLDLLLDFARLERSAPGGVYNLGTGRQTTLAEVVNRVVELTGSPSEVHWGQMAPRHWDAATWRADTALTATTFDWAPRYTLRDGLQRMLAWLEHRGEEYAATQARRAA